MWVGFVVTSEAAVVHEPAKAAFDGLHRLGMTLNLLVSGSRWTGWTLMPRRAPWLTAVVRGMGGGGLDGLGAQRAAGRLHPPYCHLAEPSYIVANGTKLCGRQLQGTSVRSMHTIAFMICRRLCSGGRPMTRASRGRARQALSTGSISSQRSSDKSLG